MPTEKEEPHRYEFKKFRDAHGGYWQLMVWTPAGDDYVIYQHRQEEILDRVAPIAIQAFEMGVQIAEKLMRSNLGRKFEHWLVHQARIQREFVISQKVEEW